MSDLATAQKAFKTKWQKKGNPVTNIKKNVQEQLEIQKEKAERFLKAALHTKVLIQKPI